ncbi:HD domain-containing protein [Sinorhizobium medicae]|uniref:HD domain-containing protein n=1 Tax=Sinorhizobium medicae TaxID=110321 RepID=A0A6G1WJ67_9HYPH|nr:HD family hydrolase [Sinorhizobium medicae]MQW01385.1 HD domain-containing protein [Sinorhizobium medicae]MQW69771.1 HD domain-containing protein [Sinorhizobium medicae]MQX85227.1 HD domain-containing protein [Sinorhizobium medicae]RVJ80313.1 HD family hydrolase [Sinorhizobium medicae]WQO86889.1 HD family hydrolase [Sinorhizobium medicae]
MMNARAWQRMLSGRRLDLLDPSPLDVELSDIAHGLARVARWNGQTSGDHAFSVAQHSLVVEEIFRLTNRCDAQDCLMALLHDAPEYVIGDMISPFKAVVGGGYKTVEKRLEGAVHIRFGLPAHTPRELKERIKKADRVAAYFEATELAGFSAEEARKFFGQPRGVTREMLLIEPLPAVEAQRLFAARFVTLESERAKARQEA